MVDWRIVTTDLRTGEVGPDVPLTGASWTQVWSRPDDFSGTVPLADCPPALLEGGRLVVHLEVGGLLVADGIVWNARVSRSGDSATVQLRGAGLASYWDRRRYRTDIDFAAVDEADIVAALVDLTEADGHGIGVDTSQVTPTGRVRDRIDEWKADDRPFIGDLIRSLTDLVDGPQVDVVVTRPDPAAPPMRTLRVRAAGSGATVAGVLRRGEAIESYDLQVSGSQQANDIESIGAGEGADMVVGRATDPSTLGLWPQLDGQTVSKKTTWKKTANAQAEAELARASRPPLSLTVQLDPDRRPRPSAWTVGDVLDVHLVDPPLRIVMPMRAVSRTWSIAAGRLEVSAVLNPTVADRPPIAIGPDPTPPALIDVGGVLTAAETS